MSDNYSSAIKNLITAVAVIVVTTFAFQYFATKDTKTGLFQYVRKAKKYMDEGKYQKAIMLLHKAYEESPDSKGITENLLYGYIKYSRELKDRGDEDKALDYLEMAYEIAPKNIPVANDYAVGLCRKAFSFARDKDYGLSMDYIKRATSMAMRAKKIRRNVSIYLLNKAVEAYNKNDPRTVFIFANMSYLLRSSFESLVMLGQHFYKISDLDKAEFYWRKAAKIKPDDIKLGKDLDKVSKEILLQNKMSNVDLGHFNVKFYREYNIDQDLLRKVLSEIYLKVGKDLDFYVPSDTPIIFYTEKDFRDALGQKGIVRGFYDGSGIKIVFRNDVKDKLFTSVIAHEYTHAVVSLLTDNRAPAWFHEGVAVYEQSRYIGYPPGHVNAFVSQGGRLSLELLEKGFAQMEDESLLGISYEGAYTAVKFILNKWGWSGLRNMILRMKKGQHYANIIDEEFYLTVPVFEKMWNEFVREEYLA